jgi:hypothetical protein
MLLVKILMDATMNNQQETKINRILRDYMWKPIFR